MTSVRETSSRLRILIVDDIPQVLNDLGILLELEPAFEIVGKADNGLEAVRLAEKLQPDLILMDLEMPGLTGYEAAAVIKSKHIDCKLAAHTIHGQPQDRQRAAACGFDFFIEKGTSIEMVLKNIQI